MWPHKILTEIQPQLNTSLLLVNEIFRALYQFLVDRAKGLWDTGTTFCQLRSKGRN